MIPFVSNILGYGHQVLCADNIGSEISAGLLPGNQFVVQHGDPPYAIAPQAQGAAG